MAVRLPHRYRTSRAHSPVTLRTFKQARVKREYESAGDFWYDRDYEDDGEDEFDREYVDDEYDSERQYGHCLGVVAKPKRNPPKAHNYYMHYKELELRQKKRESRLTTSCFYATIAIDFDNDDCLVVTANLLDSGAGAHFISRRLVNAMNLKPTKVEPHYFQVATGQEVSFTEYVRISIWLGGVEKCVTAMVDDSHTTRLFLLGEPMFDDFLLSMSPLGVGSQRTKNVTVANDITGCRKARFVVQRDLREPSQMLVVHKSDHRARRAREGRTAGEVAAKMKGDAMRQRVKDAFVKVESAFW